MPRFDIPCRRSGFWGVVPVKAAEESAEVELAADVQDSAGRAVRVPLGTVSVIDRDASPSRDTAAAQTPIAICMGTFEPDLELFRAQVQSLRAQTAEDWICVISDDCSNPERFQDMLSVLAGDDRFVVSRSEGRIGFYRNFERALRSAPPGASLIALCDQDDVWHPDKLAALRDALGPAMLVYSDQRLVDPNGMVLRETLWRGRRNNFTSIGSMLVANTVTGAASLFRRDVLERALPFPDSPGNDFHDHWIALVALASGSIAYVNRPLYDYVQHRTAVLSQRAELEQRAGRRRLIGRPSASRWRSAYFFGYLPGEIRAQTLLLRCGDRLSASKRRTLERYLASTTSPAALAWLFLRPLRALTGRTETLAAEWQLARGLAWLRLARLIAKLPKRWPDRWTLDTRLPDPATFEQKRLRRWRERN
jgi:glycosyltransferase involved in cell wall biosynthesis